MNQFVIPHRLKRMRAMFPLSPPDRLVETSKPTSDAHSRRAEPASPGKIHRMLRIWLGNPWDDYEYLHHLGQDMVATRKASYFKLVTIRQCHSSNVVEQSRLLSSLQSPNIATIYDLYCDDDQIFQVTEYLDTSLSQLGIQKYELEEWEMATIIMEVLKGIAHISELKFSCRNLSRADIGLTLDGEIKIVLDLHKLQHDHLYEGSNVPQILLDFPILAELIEDMMLSRYHLTSEDEKLSEDALNFLACTLSGSLETLMKHRFLTLAVSPRKLIPRIRFSFEWSRGASNGIEEDGLSRVQSHRTHDREYISDEAID